MPPRPAPNPRERRFVAVAVVVIAVDGLVNLVIFTRFWLLALVQFALAGWLAWRIWWAPRAGH